MSWRSRCMVITPLGLLGVPRDVGNGTGFLDVAKRCSCYWAVVVFLGGVAIL